MPQADPSTSCPLSPADQTRNLLIYAACKSLIYLAAPVLYIGVQPSLCDWLGASTFVANLPKVALLVFSVTPVFFAWFCPYVSFLRLSLTSLLVVSGLGPLIVVAALLSPLPDELKIAAIIVQSALNGMAIPTSDSLLWEMIARGVSESRRGLTLSLAFGVGPLFAALSSVGSQAILNKETRARWAPELQEPWTFIIIFAATAPMMLLAAFLTSLCVVPRPEREHVREPFLQGVFGGSWDYLRDRILLIATIVTILVYAANAIDSNMSLYTEEAMGESPKEYVGLQMVLRFSFKAAAGLLLGWLLTRTSPKAGLLATALIFLASVFWAMIATGEWYLLTFGIFGAGELIGVYAPNYILTASRKHEVRRNMAFANMILAPVGFFGLLFGWSAEFFGDMYDKTFGFRVSFALCAALTIAGILLAAIALPKKPQPDQP